MKKIELENIIQKIAGALKVTCEQENYTRIFAEIEYLQNCTERYCSLSDYLDKTDDLITVKREWALTTVYACQR